MRAMWGLAAPAALLGPGGPGDLDGSGDTGAALATPGRPWRSWGSPGGPGGLLYLFGAGKLEPGAKSPGTAGAESSPTSVGKHSVLELSMRARAAGDSRTWSTASPPLEDAAGRVDEVSSLIALAVCASRRLSIPGLRIAAARRAGLGRGPPPSARLGLRSKGWAGW
ncbi:hypothetical protein T492DRAFT_916282 [Pavlovales sp. CCMP2436]|nr:hypothetical protein T492DRAFT_916282 [Pavlovales sp. CCMP2436]